MAPPKNKKDNPLTYKAAGVDIATGNAFVKMIQPFVKQTQRTGADTNLGGFGGVFDLKACGFEDPLLVATTDGVGTKLKIAFAMGSHATIGIDLVAMCVNDIVVQGAEPLFFLDYYSTSKLHPSVATAVVQGITEGCKTAGCSLIGGETAEMPGMYQKGHYDLAGFCVGAVERSQLLPAADIQEGDVLLGLASSGLHSNGFSFVRHLIRKKGLDYSTPAPFFPGKTLGEILLTPTRIYVPSLLPLAKARLIKGLAHITGGGLLENIPRILPSSLAAFIDCSTWPQLPVFQWLAEASHIKTKEMLRTFNCGIGMVMVVAKDKKQQVLTSLKAQGETAYEIGTLISRKKGPVEFTHTEALGTHA